MGVLPGSEEEALMGAAEARNASIFACESHKVYDTESTGTFHTPEGNFSSNAGVFLRIWQKVFSDRLYLAQDWTIKVDPDTVWSPQRLRGRRWASATDVDDAIYVKNTKLSFGFLGPIEILSRGAVARLSEVTADRCATSIGEDGWLKDCMNNNGIQAVEDLGLLNSKETVELCGDKSFVAFHCFKRPDVWNACLDLMRKVQ